VKCGKYTHKPAYKILFGKHEGKSRVLRQKNNEEMGLKNQCVRIGVGLILFRISFTGSCDCGREPLGSIS